jgi:peptidoglycan hydrolase CwlO-like protein
MHPSSPTQNPFAYVPASPFTGQPPTPEQEVAALENYEKELEAERADLEQEMGEIASRIEELRAKIEQTEKKTQ